MSTVDDRQVAVSALIHPADRLGHRLVGPDRVGIGGHHLAELGLGGVAAGGDDADHHVALGEDAGHAALVHDQDAAAAVLGHALGGRAHGLLGVGGDERRAEAPAAQDGADGSLAHGSYPLMLV